MKRILCLFLVTVLLVSSFPCAFAASEGYFEGVFVLTMNAEETAANGMHGGLQEEHPCVTTNTLTLHKDGTYTWDKVMESEGEEKEVYCHYVFEGTYPKGKANKLALNPAEKCTFEENYGKYDGASPIGAIANRSGDEQTDPICLEYFSTGCLVWNGNNEAKVSLDEKAGTFTIKDHNNEWSYMWKGDTEPKIAQFVAQTYEMRPLGQIVYYGASNFRLWLNMEEDMRPYAVQNHGVGGSVDVELMEFADVLLFPFAPKVVFIQTGSNDYLGDMTMEECFANKEKMYGMFAENLPDTKFCIMAGLPLPNRAQYWDLTVQVNDFIRDYCENHENFYFVDGTDAILTDTGDESMQTGDGRFFNPAIFKGDGIHLTQEGHDLWTPYMVEQLKALGFGIVEQN